MDSEVPHDDELVPMEGPIDDDSLPSNFAEAGAFHGRIGDRLDPHSEFDPVQEMIDRLENAAGEPIRLPHESDDNAPTSVIRWPIARSDDPPRGIQQLPYLIPARPGDGASSNGVKNLTADDVQLTDGANYESSQPPDDVVGADQQPYFNPPEPGGGGMFPLGSASSAAADSLDDLADAEEGQDIGDSDGASDADLLDEESPENDPPTTSSDLGSRATSLTQNTADGGPPLARPMVLVSLTNAATQRLIEESLAAASDRDSKTLESIAKAKVHDAFWIRDAQRRAVTGDW